MSKPKCPYPSDPRWLVEYQYEIAVKVAQSISDLHFYLYNLSKISGKWKPAFKKLQELREVFDSEYDDIICKLISYKEGK